MAYFKNLNHKLSAESRKAGSYLTPKKKKYEQLDEAFKGMSKKDNLYKKKKS